jgi:hypothetical protein
MKKTNRTTQYPVFASVLCFLLAALFIVLAAAGGPETAYAMPPTPIDSEPKEPPELPDHFTWNMLPRFGQDADGDGIIDYHFDSAYVNPSTFKVEFKACPPPPGGQGNRYGWTIDVTLTSITNCRFTIDLTPGSHHVKFTATPTTGPGTVYEEDINVRDILIVSLGDSIASGEGNPDIPQRFDISGFVTAGAKWVDRRCHRSAYAGPAQAALAIEQRDPHTSVTFVSLACSGASVRHLNELSYMGTEPGPDDTVPLPPQLDALRQIVGTRHIDALLISGGANDINFANIIANCVLYPYCNYLGSMTTALDQDLRDLVGRYAGLTGSIALGSDGDVPQPGLDVGDVYFTEYPNMMHAADGSVCNSILGEILWPLGIDQQEAAWAETAAYQRLNDTVHQAVDAAAASYPNIGWHDVGGISAAFAGPGYGHGYCAGDQSWIRTAHISAALQGPLASTTQVGNISFVELMATRGTIHPTARGHQVYRDQLLSLLLPRLFPNQPLPQGPIFSAHGSSGADTNVAGTNGWVTGSCNGSACTSNQVVLEVAATDASDITGTGVAVDGSSGCAVSGVTCTTISTSAQQFGWRFDITSEGIHRLEFAAQNGNEQVATFTYEMKVDLTDPTATAIISDAVPGTAGWYTVPVSVTLGGTDTAGSLGLGSGVYLVAYTLDGVPGQVTAGQVVPVTTDGVHTLAYRSIDLAGRQSVTQTMTVKVDLTPPALNCAAPDGQWHAADVSLACTASDSASGLSSAADAAFNLATSVAGGSETSNAVTGSRNVCDLAGNCAQAGPIGGNKVDKQNPAITLTTPTSTTYSLKQAVLASYSCADGGSGVATCAGPAANGSPLDTASTGAKGFTVNAADNVGHAISQTVSYTVTYNLCVLYDQTKSHRKGSTVPIKLQLCDAAGANQSAAGIVITATGLAAQDTTASSIVDDSGNANPDSNFRYDPTLGGYIYNLSTNGLSTGTWVLTFAVAGDPVAHTVQFDVK